MSDGPLDLPAPHTVPTNELSFVMADRRNQIWVSGNYGGITCIDKASMAFQQFNFQQNVNSISDTYIFESLEDEIGNIWIATKKGALNKFDPKTKQFTHYNGKFGLQSDHLHKLAMDRDGHIWLKTYTGISSFNPKTEQFTNYNREDGLLSWQPALEINSRFNTLIFGGKGGFHTAAIDDLKKQSRQSASLVLNPRLNVKQIAQQMHLSYQQLYRKLKALTDKTMVQYLRTYRLQKAKVLLQTQPDLNVSEVAYDVGFDSPSYFSWVFLEEFGLSPNKVRNTTL